MNLNTKKNAYKQNILYILLVLTIMYLPFSKLFAEETVYFDSNTPFLDEIYIILKNNNYHLTQDSTNAYYVGEISTNTKKDSTQYQVIIKDEYKENIIGTFSKEQIKKTDVRKNMKKYVLYGLFLNTITLLLYFLRST